LQSPLALVLLSVWQSEFRLAMAYLLEAQVVVLPRLLLAVQLALV
jgi:hypothetical protein